MIVPVSKPLFVRLSDGRWWQRSRSSLHQVRSINLQGFSSNASPGMVVASATTICGLEVPWPTLSESRVAAEDERCRSCQR